eukprot:TRINITY_DN13545_c0_g2_i1.p1 TRINITY_DN13545_c0_g2~~TRINITY_DN13545_c0_g2_i1.p1  ORF type:complete len:196 (+),score=19.13 TRINITY_DN13545_c0_g2_i1:81-668(+)
MSNHPENGFNNPPHNGENQKKLREYVSQELMQASHDPTTICLSRLFFSWKLRIYYMVSSAIALVSIVFLLYDKHLPIELILALLLYIGTACEVGGRIRLKGVSSYFRSLSNLIEVGVCIGGLIILIYRSFFTDGLIARVTPFFIILGKNVWEYYGMLKEENEKKQTKARASEEVAFENLEDNTHIEVELNHNLKK